MIQALFDEFLAHHCGCIPPDDVQRLTTALCGYLSRVVRSGRLMRLAKELDIESEFFDLRKRLDGNPYSSSRIWRAVWLNLRGCPRKAVRRYEIQPDDMDWVISNLTVKQTKQIERLAKDDWLQMPDYAGIEREVLSMAPYCQRYAKKLSFIVKYDPSLTLADFEHDMLAAGLSAAYRSDNRTENLVWLRNIAWRSAKNHAVSIIKYHTTKGRQRIERHEKSIEMSSNVTVYRRSTCWRCKLPAMEALCAKCSDEIKQSKAETERWSDHNESPKKFMTTRANVTVEPVAHQSTEGFRGTITYLDAPLRTDDGEATLLDMTADHVGPTSYGSAETADLVHDIRHQPAAVQSVCAVILGGKDAAFESWLAERHGSKASKLRDRKLTSEACEFYGIPRYKLRAAMAPLLGVSA